MSRHTSLAPLQYAAAVTFGAAILVASVVDPGDGVPRTVLWIETTVYLHVVGYAALAPALGTGAWRLLARRLGARVGVDGG